MIFRDPGIPVPLLTKLLKGEKLQVGIHDATMQALAERGLVHWTEQGWKIPESPPELVQELRRQVATEMLGKDDER
jgi:hypothetical protein